MLPAVKMPESCGELPAGVLVVPPATSTQLEEASSVPTARPMTMVDGGPATVNVTSTWPACDTGMPYESLLLTATVPLWVSVVRVTVVAVVGVLVVLLLQPAARHASAAT